MVPNMNIIVKLNSSSLSGIDVKILNKPLANQIMKCIKIMTHYDQLDLFKGAKLVQH